MIWERLLLVGSLEWEEKESPILCLMVGKRGILEAKKEQQF